MSTAVDAPATSVRRPSVVRARRRSARHDATSVRPAVLRLLWIALALSLLPVGVDVGLPFEVSPADALLPLAAPGLLLLRPSPRAARLFAVLVITSLTVVLAWALVSGEGGPAEVASWAFFWKSWVALFLAHGLVVASADRRAAVHRVLGLVSWALVALIGIALAGWAVTGRVIWSARTATGLIVTSFTAGTWDFPVRLYGYGQVNVTANLLALAGPLFAYRAARARSVVARAAWLGAIPVSWWLIVNSGSRGALVTAGLFVCLLILTPTGTSHRISPLNILLTVVLALAVVTQAQRVIDASPKYARTMEAIRTGDTESAASGRGDLNSLTLSDVYRSPVVGTGFGDYHRFHTETDTKWVDSSPHNAYLGPFLKGGIPLGLGYLALLAMVLPWRRPEGLTGLQYLTLPFTVPLAVGELPVGDVLTTPVLAATILTVCGAMLAARRVAHEADEAEAPYASSARASENSARKASRAADARRARS